MKRSNKKENTGFKYKDGKPIYTGDIIEFTHEAEGHPGYQKFILLVKWEPSRGSFVTICPRYGIPSSSHSVVDGVSVTTIRGHIDTLYNELNKTNLLSFKKIE